MTLREHIDNPDRRTTDLAPLAERRGGTERRVPVWLQRARDGALYGYDDNGKPVAGKIMDAA